MNLKERLATEQKEKAENAKKVAQLTMQVDWMKKSEETLADEMLHNSRCVAITLARRKHAGI